MRERERHSSSGPLAIIFAILVIVWRSITVLALVFLFGFYAVVDGVANIVHYFSDPRRCHPDRALRRGEKDAEILVDVLATGVVYALFGLCVLILPGAGILSMLGLLAAFAFITGVLLLAEGLQLRGFSAESASEHRGPRPSTP